MRRIAEKVPKPYPNFPLFASSNGCWRKKIAGKKRSFGPVRWPNAKEYDLSWRAALTAYHNYLEAKAHGNAITADPRACSIRLLHDSFLTMKHEEAEKGDIKPRTFADIRTFLREYRDVIGTDVTVGELEADPSPIHEYLAKVDAHYGFHAFNRRMQYIRSSWNWAANATAGGLLDRPFKWAGLHKQKPMKTFRRQRRHARAAGIQTTFEADEVAALIEHSLKGWRLSPQVRAFVLLGYFAAYGNTDLAELPATAVTVYEKAETFFVQGRREMIPAGWAILDFPRPKTEIDRCAIVPPIVVEALRSVQALKRPATRETRHLVFRTEGGRPVVYDVIHRDASELIQRTTPTDNVAASFVRLMKSIGWCAMHGWVRKKSFLRTKENLCSTCGAAIELMQPRGFYCLRHTATTFAAGSGASNDVRNLFEGHGGGGVRQAFYLDPTKLHDLLLIARDLERRLTDSASANGPSPSVVPA